MHRQREDEREQPQPAHQCATVAVPSWDGAARNARRSSSSNGSARASSPTRSIHASARSGVRVLASAISSSSFRFARSTRPKRPRCSRRMRAAAARSSTVGPAPRARSSRSWCVRARRYTWAARPASFGDTPRRRSTAAYACQMMMPSPTTSAATVTEDATSLLFDWLLLLLRERDASPSAFSVPEEPSLVPPSSELREASSVDSLSLDSEWLVPSSPEPLDSDWLEPSPLEPLDSEWLVPSSPEPLDSDRLEPSPLEPLDSDWLESPEPSDDAPESDWLDSPEPSDEAAESDPSDEAAESEPSDEAAESEPSEALMPPPGPNAAGALHPETVITTAMHSARFTDFFVFIERISRCPSVLHVGRPSHGGTTDWQPSQQRAERKDVAISRLYARHHAACREAHEPKVRYALRAR
ncbi:hypothetical protein MXAN_6887 [Myxococcus xanthus DK 1622]|uniref:Uncharacterized protein n=2 Tax=Myxococcus xanthus TaxID=34 RepID=Q1CX72_MYXXD|nr:hypothetical protein MXAN_6887 [Myxococcus xanthus DK 1622]